MIDESNSQRHHFVPQFYLREWYMPGRDHFLLYGRDSRHQLYSRSRPSKSVGFESDLYAITPDGLNFQPTKSHQLESDFFAPIDNLASVVHQKMLSSGVRSLTAQDRNDWSKFISSMLERSPKRIHEISKLSAEGIQKTLAKLSAQETETLNQPTFHSVIASINQQSLARNLALEKITPVIADDKFIQDISSMQWALVHLQEEEDHFLTSDNPLVINSGEITQPIYIFSLAVSPKSLLVIFKASYEFDGMLQLMAVIYNGLLVNQTNKHLVSSRALVDGMCIKYKKMAELMLCTNHSILRGVNS